MSATRHHNGYRHPKTLQEIKANIEFKNTGLVRGARFNLPNSWDDICIMDYKDKSWKNKRKHKYKTGKEKKYSKHIIKFKIINYYRYSDEFHHLFGKICDFCFEHGLHYLEKHKYNYCPRTGIDKQVVVERKYASRHLSTIESTVEWVGPCLSDIVGKRHVDLHKFCVRWKVVK